MGRTRRLRRFEVQFQRLRQIGKSFFLSLALARNVEIQALRNVPLPFTPDCCREWSFHVLILSQRDAIRTPTLEPTPSVKSLVPAAWPIPARVLSPDERASVRALLNSERFQACAPAALH